MSARFASLKALSVRFRRAVGTGALVLAGGCQMIGGGPSASHPIEAPPPGTQTGTVYQGVLFMEGGEISAALELAREGRTRVMGALQTSTGLLADGEGEARGEQLRLTLRYGGECPGRMVMDGEWDRDAQTYEGDVEASDCTGQSRGTFSFAAS